MNEFHIFTFLDLLANAYLEVDKVMAFEELLDCYVDDL